MKKLFTLFLGIMTFCCIAITSYAQNDTIPPVVLEFHAEFTNDAVTDSAAAVFTLTFSEAIELLDTFTIVTRYHDNEVWEEFDQYDGSEVVIEDNVLTVTAERSFWTQGTYEFVMTAGSVQDSAGNLSDSFVRTFVADEDVPEVTDFNIELTGNELNDSISAVFTLTYSEDVQLNEEFTIATHVFENDTNPEYDRYVESQITVNGNVITITPERMFSLQHRYELVVTFGSVSDLSGNWATSYTRVFVPDVVAPEVVDVETTFTDSEFADSLNVSFTVNYDEDVKLAPTYSFVINQRNAGGWGIYEQVADTNIVVSGNTITLNPTRLISNSVTYELVITAGSVRDLVDNPATSYTEIFLRDTIRPQLIEISPDFSQPVPTNAIFTFIFSEDVRLDENFGFLTYHWSADSSKYIEYEKLDASQATVENNVVTFDPSLDFRPNEQVQIVLTSGSVLDITGNLYQYITDDDTLNYVSERFWSAEGGVTFVDFLPRDDDSLAYIPDELTITFSEAITLTDTTDVNDGSLDSLVYLRSDGTDIEHDATYDVNTNVITIIPTESLASGSSYTFGFTDGFLNEANDSIPAGEATFTILGESLAIAEIHGDGETSPYLGQEVMINGTVTAVYTDEGFYVQDENAAKGGIWVEYTDPLQLEVGDGVMVTGMVEEADGRAYITAEVVTPADAPLTVEPIVLDFGTDSIPMYQGVLVQVTEGRATEANMDGEWTIFADSDLDSLIVSSQLYAYSPVADDLYDVTGVVTFRDSVLRIEPRMEADVVTTTTSVDLTPGIDFNVYPNPFGNYIKISNNDKLTRVIVSNITGQRVLDLKNPNAEINTSHLISGVYIINMFKENNLVKTSRIVKQ